MHGSAARAVNETFASGRISPLVTTPASTTCRKRFLLLDGGAMRLGTHQQPQEKRHAI